MKNRFSLAPATISDFDGVRYLHLGTEWVQGAMRQRKPHAIELEYVRRMMAWMLWLPPELLGQSHAVQLGLGAGTITRFCHRTLKMRTTAVEINPTVIGMCRAYFHLPENDKHLQVVASDAARWVSQPAHKHVAQSLCVDLYDHEAAAPVLDDEAFYAACRDVLADEGVMSVNLFGRHASFARSAGRIAAVFGTDCVWSLEPTKEGNTVVVAARRPEIPSRDELERRADTIEAEYGLPARRWLRMVRPLTLT